MTCLLRIRPSMIRTSMRPIQMRPLLLSAVVACLWSGTPSFSAEEWTDVSGTRTMIADFVGIWGDKAVFALPDGRRKPVELKMLQAESRLRALDLAEQSKTHLQEFKQELQQRATAAKAPGDTRIGPATVPAPAYQPLASGASLQMTASNVSQQMRNGHVRVLWDSLPPKYQQDIEELVVEFANKMDPQLWNQQVQTIDRLTQLLASREKWVFSHPQIATMVASDESTARSMYQAMIGMVQAITDPEKVSLQRLQQGNLGELIAEQNELLAGHLFYLQNQSNAPLSVKLDVKMIDKTHGTVAMQAAEGVAGNRKEAPTKMTLVDGRWVPEEMAESWDKDIAAARESLANLPNQLDSLRFAVDGFSQSVDQFLSPLETAESSDAFHSGIDAMLADVAMLAMQSLGGMSQSSRGSDGSMDYEGGAGYDMEPGYGSEAGYGSEPGYDGGTSPMGMESYETEMSGSGGGSPMPMAEGGGGVPPGAGRRPMANPERP